jgi:hypothetical protein
LYTISELIIEKHGEKMNITMTRRHNTTLESAVTTLKKYNVEKLIEDNLPNGVVVSKVQNSWQYNKMSFSLNAKKGGIGGTVKGWLEIGEKNISINLEIPKLARLFFSKEDVKTGIEKQLAELFPN